MSGAKQDSGSLVIGGLPRIDFLPLEVKQRKANRRSRRSLVFLVLAVVAVCITGYVFSAGVAVSSQAELDSARAETARLLAEQGKYSEANSVASNRDAAINAAKVGSATEVLWKPYLADLMKVLPSDAKLSAITVNSQSSLELAPVSNVLLEKPRVATINFTVTSDSLTEAGQIVERLKKLRGFADATVTEFAMDEEGVMTATAVLNVNSDAFERRLLAPLPADDATATDVATEEQD